MQEIRNKARELMGKACRVCPVCDGRVCAGEVPGMGGLGSATAFKNNVQALSSITLNMRLIHGAKMPATTTSWLGLNLEMPVIASPIGGMFNFNQAMTEDAYAAAVLEGSRAAGSIGCTGDGVPPAIIDAAMAGLAGVNGYGIPFIKPWESAELDEKMERVFAAGCKIMGMDIDAAGLTTLRKMGRPVGPKSLKELSAIIEKAHRTGIQFIVKGIMTVRDAYNAVESGADAILVSNHGGRVLESTPGVARVLPAIAKAVHNEVSIVADGGVRSGADVLKMLALGADMVGIGRPVTVAAVGGGSAGVATYLNTIKNELAQTMILTGCKDIASITENTLFEPYI